MIFQVGNLAAEHFSAQGIFIKCAEKSLNSTKNLNTDNKKNKGDEFV